MTTIPFNKGFGDVGSQAAMIVDERRTGSYQRAIAAVVKPGDVVIDVGAGSGVLSMFAARAGAAKVYAIERTGMAHLATQLVEQNGLSDVVEILNVDLEDIETLDPKPNVMIGEILGHFAPDEEQHRFYGRAAKLCAPNPTVIPGSYRMVFAPACERQLADDIEQLRNIGGLSFSPVIDRIANRVYIRVVDPEDLRGPEVTSDSVDSLAAVPASYSCTLKVGATGPINAIVASFVADLGGGVEISTSAHEPTTSWMQTYFPVMPELHCQAGDTLEFEIWPRIVGNSKTWTWDVKRGDEVRTGDVLDSLVGDPGDTFSLIGLQRSKLGEVGESHTLRRWIAMLGAQLGSADEMADTLYKALPADFANLAEARQEVLRFLDAAEALR